MTRDELLLKELEGMELPSQVDSAELLPERTKGRTLHVDGDMLAYFFGVGDGYDRQQARTYLVRRVEAFAQLSGSDKIIIHLTHRGSNKGFRLWFSQFTGRKYQSSRKGQRPENWEYLRRMMETKQIAVPGYEVTIVEHLMQEADDGMAQAAARAPSDTTVVIASRDKDLRMITGCYHIDWMDFTLTHVPRDAFKVHKEGDDKVYGLWNFYYQMLAGDTADNVVGLPRLFGKPCGKKAAEAYLLSATSADDAHYLVTSAYRAYHGDDKWAQVFVAMAVLLWMRRVKDDFDALTYLTSRYVRYPYLSLEAAGEELRTLFKETV